ncbi:MAG TPA: pyridoxal-dependent decarboxylase [Actinocrinis sp.]|nr:pyridoxal-dependent decarboxylase [Actinocrinis sp.]
MADSSSSSTLAGSGLAAASADSAVRDDLRAAADLAATYLGDVAERPVWQAMPEQARAALLDAPLPENGRAVGELLDEAARRVLVYPMGNGHPAFFGWVNAAPHPAAVAAGLLASASNPSSAGGDHADVPLERAVVRWLAQLVGYPHQTGAGLLTSGASMATIVAVGAARHRALERAGWNVRERGLAGAPQLTAYATAEAHSCVRKAIELLGIGSHALRTVPERFGTTNSGTGTGAEHGAGSSGAGMDVEALREMIAQDRAAGRLPFLVVASAGTVNTGAIDPFEQIADVCKSPDGHEGGLWLHVDGAYGAFGVLDEGVAARYAGMARADSLALDPHKWLQVPIGVGALLVADRELLRSAFSLVPPYLRDESGDALGWLSEYGIEQTRQFRALPVWASIAARGREGVARDVAACIEAARELARLVGEAPDLELAAPVELSIVAFRYAPRGVTAQEADRVNAALPVAIQERGAAFVTGSVYRGRPVLRACVINPATREEHVRLLVAEARAAGAALIAGSAEY